MINITFPDGSTKQFEAGITAFGVAESISKSLAKSALIAQEDDRQIDLNKPLTKDCRLRLLTNKDPESLEIIRHDAAHILAMAVKDLFPNVQVTIGPATADGFYYDFATEEAFSEEDLIKIEKKMHHIVQQNIPFEREVWQRDDAIKFFKEQGEHYKAEIIESIPGNEELTLYKQGDFYDLCRGPHAPSTGKIKHFKLMKLAGAYWRGDSNNQMLQRIYGVAFASEEELKAHLHMLEEAAKRDHRRLGKDLDLFHFQEEAQGMVFWHQNGWTIYQLLQKYIRNKLFKHGYGEVNTPIKLDRKLWEQSGHWEKFREDMFTLESEDKVYALKPMNCPCHVQIFKQGTKSYRDLPLRMAEFGSCFRNEASGALHGLMRVRHLVQDDGHIFCTEEQINSETVAFCNLLREVYKDFGFTELQVRFSDRPEMRAGSDETWDKAEDALKCAIEEVGMDYQLNPGEGAFYGPKLEFVLTDAIGRKWQCGTLQVDFVLPERLGAEYVAAGGEKKRPVMLHRALFGSFERFIGILIEEYAGKFPLALAPSQVAIATITDEVDNYAQDVFNKLINAGIRVIYQPTSDKINYKIRQYSNMKIPLIAVIGKGERQDGTVTLRKLGGSDQDVMKIDDLIDFINKENKKFF